MFLIRIKGLSSTILFFDIFSVIFFFLEPVNRYNFLDNSVGISSVVEISNGSLIDKGSQIVETPRPLSIPGVEGLLIPCNTRGHILKVIDGNTALVRWEVNYFCVLDPIFL